jgi:hypothetical protein
MLSPKRITSTSTTSPPIGESLRDAVSVLALLIKRHQDLDELLSRDERRGDLNDENDRPITATKKSCTITLGTDKGGDADTDTEDPEEDERIGVDEGTDEELYLAALKDKVLDRLAETLARYKSDPSGNQISPLASKHVSSTMMMVGRQSTRVKFLCSKNEGLDQGDTAEDTKFLDSWRQCMECISKPGKVIRRFPSAIL